jgi:PAS domain S-box-containing protein
MATVCIFAGLVFFTARLVDRLDAERRSREADLRVSEERFRAVAQTASDAIITADQLGNIGLWNKAAETIFGFAPSEILGRPVATLMPERFQAAHKMGMEQAVSAGESKLAGHAVELTGLRKDGSEFPLELSLAMWRKDEEILFTGIVRDITRRKTAEAERDRMIAELQKTLAEVKTLKGLIPICASCKKIRDDTGFWSQIESYVMRHSDAKFSHGICPDCTKKLYPEYADEPGQNQSLAPARQSVRTLAPEMPTKTTGGDQAILLVETDHAARGSTWQALKHGGYTVVAVADGLEAIQALSTRPGEFGLVVMEQAMPVMDGVMTLHALRHLEQNIQVILLTDGANVVIPADVRANVRACLAKPFTNEQLLAAARQAIAKLRSH